MLVPLIVTPKVQAEQVSDQRSSADQAFTAAGCLAGTPVAPEAFKTAAAKLRLSLRFVIYFQSFASTAG